MATCGYCEWEAPGALARALYGTLGLSRVSLASPQKSNCEVAVPSRTARENVT